MVQSTNYPKRFLGRGLSFPLEISDTQGGRNKTVSGASVSDGVERIRQSLLQILYTRLGERVMKRTFGSDFSSFVFEPLDRTVLDQLAYVAQKAIEVWEPRITVSKFEIVLIDKKNALLQIDLAFIINATNSLENLVFPFYLSDFAASRSSTIGSNYLSSDGTGVE